MKKILLAISLFFICVAASAQPKFMTYQVVVRNANNELVVNQQVGIRVSILQDSMNGGAVFMETHTPTTNSNGLATVSIGNGTSLLVLTLDDIEWGEHDFFLKTDIDPAGGINYTISGTQPLQTLPYAFYAEYARLADTAMFLKNTPNSDTAKYSGKSDTANFSYNSLNSSNAAYSDTAKYSGKSDTANYSFNSLNSSNAAYSDTAKYSWKTDTANFSFNSLNSSNAAYSDTAKYAGKSDTANFSYNSLNSFNAAYSDTAKYAGKSDTANFSYNSLNSLNAAYSDTAKYSWKTDTANFSYNSLNSSNAVYSDTAKYSWKTDTANFSFNSLNSSNAVYSDTAKYSGKTDTANFANVTAVALYADTAARAGTAISANTAHSAIYADTAATADFNNLINKPVGANTGDILYWNATDSSWHIVPVGTVGETLTLDSNNIPRWSSVATSTVTLATIVTDSVTNITTNSARAVGTVSADGGSPFVFSGLCWGISQNPTTSDFHTLDGIGLGSVSSNIPSLTMGTVYYVRAFATNSAGTAYGNELSFRTQTYPVVTTNSVTNISVNAAISGGDVTDDGGATVTARGVCWSTLTAPTTADSHTTDGTGTGTFLSSISSLARNTKYYVRAYATNYIGTTYGDTVSFTTLADFPTVTTSAVGSITSVTAVVGGDVTDDGDAPVTARGICYNTTGNPTLADNVLPIGSGTGSFSSTLTGLNASTVYYICAYATNSRGTSYGSTDSFTTADPWTCGISTITDYDNNVYNTVKIGSQCWMKENLKTAHYANGTLITLITGTGTSSDSIPYRYYPNNDSNNLQNYGYLYNWSAAMNGCESSALNPSGVQGICPNGWHLPSDTEWTQLTDYISSQSQYWCDSNSTYIGMALASTYGWTQESGTCYVGNDLSENNSTGLGLLPAGYIHSGNYYQFGTSAPYWSATEKNSSHAYYRYLSYGSAEITSGNNGYKYRADAVRCLKD